MIYRHRVIIEFDRNDDNPIPIESVWWKGPRGSTRGTPVKVVTYGWRVLTDEEQA